MQVFFGQVLPHECENDVNKTGKISKYIERLRFVNFCSLTSRLPIGLDFAARPTLASSYLPFTATGGWIKVYLGITMPKALFFENVLISRKPSVEVEKL